MKKKTASRRSFIRIPFEKGRGVTVRTNQGAREFQPIDVSVYGISFMAMSEAAKEFHDGMKLNDVDFTIQNRRIQVTAKVAYVRPQPGKDHFKVALEFLEIPTDDVFFISKHITEVAGLNAPKTQVKVWASRKKKPKLKAKPKVKKKAKAKAKVKAKVKVKSRIKTKTKTKTKKRASAAPHRSRK